MIQPQIQRVIALRSAYAQPIIAAGLLNSSRDLWSGVLEVLAKRDGQHYKSALDAFFERVRAAGVDMSIPLPQGPSAGGAEAAGDVCLSCAGVWGDAGFFLGLAVGMQLGPDALPVVR